MSTAGGGEPSSFEPGLEHLIGALTASGHPHELAGRDAARAAFARPASSRRRPGRASPRRTAPRRPVSASRRRPIRIALPARLAVAIAAVVAVLGGFTAAAAAQALPAPVQRIAYSVLAPLGVPVSQPAKSPHVQSAATRPPASATGPASGRGGCPCPSASSQTSAALPGPSITPPASPRPRPRRSSPTPRPFFVWSSGRHQRPPDRGRALRPTGRHLVTLAEWTDAAWTTVASAPLGPGRAPGGLRPAGENRGRPPLPGRGARGRHALSRGQQPPAGFRAPPRPAPRPSSHPHRRAQPAPGPRPLPDAYYHS